MSAFERTLKLHLVSYCISLRRVYDSRHLQAESAPEPYAWQSSMGYIYLFIALWSRYVRSVLAPRHVCGAEACNGSRYIAWCSVVSTEN